MTPDRTRFQLAPDIWFDARRAIFLAQSGTLAVADLHLGYAWAHRHGGQLLPLSMADNSTARLLALVDDYAPREIVLLGDIVHQAVPVPELRKEVCQLCEALAERAELRLVVGNHDARLAEFCGREVHPAWEAGPHLLLHGDGAGEVTARARLAEVSARGGRIFLGHEHPAITLSAGVASHVKCACFLVSPAAVVLPAFSPWAAGTNIHEANFLSSYSREVKFRQAIAICAGKLLPVTFIASAR